MKKVEVDVIVEQQILILELFREIASVSVSSPKSSFRLVMKFKQRLKNLIIELM